MYDNEYPVGLLRTVVAAKRMGGAAARANESVTAVRRTYCKPVRKDI